MLLQNRIIHKNNRQRGNVLAKCLSQGGEAGGKQTPVARDSSRMNLLYPQTESELMSHVFVVM